MTGCGAHPRSRGEHVVNNFRNLLSVGSSPLARGTLSYPFIELLGSGLIPARAGNTYSTPAVLIRRRAHPRSRGEHARAEPVNSPAAGSSPLARGTLWAS